MTIKKNYIGIDVGTSSTKILVIDEDGKVINGCTKRYSVTEQHNDWQEIDPQLWYDACIEGISELLDKCDLESVAAIIVTGQMHTTVFLDDDGNSIRPAIMWNDERSKELVSDIQSKFTSSPETEDLSKTVSIGSPAASLYWLKNREPESFSRINKFLIGPNYITFKLTGKYLTDYCLASTSSLFNWETRKWSSKAMDLLGFPESIFPQICGSGLVAGSIKEETAAKLGLRKDVKVYVGTGDNVASALSVGCISSKIPLISLGTSGVLLYVRDTAELPKIGKPVLYSPDGNKFSNIVQGSLQACCSDIDWWRDKVQNTNGYNIPDFNQYYISNEVMFYPHLSGEKTLYGNPRLRGAFIGLSLNTTAEEMSTAIIEGLAFGFKNLFKNMFSEGEEPKKVFTVGGGKKYLPLLKTLSNVLQCEIVQIDKSDAVYGIVNIAIEAERGVPLCLSTDIVQTIYPQDCESEQYEKKYQKYLVLQKAMEYIYGK